MTARRTIVVLAAGAMAWAQGDRDQAPQVNIHQPEHWYERLAGPYEIPSVPLVDVRNSPRLYDVLRAGRLYLSLADAIALALENNLDVEMERFGPRIADLDLLRARGGGTLRGINYTISELPPGIGGPATPLLNTPATGTVGSTSVPASLIGTANAVPTPTDSSILEGSFSAGPAIPTFDPALTGGLSWQQAKTPEANLLASGTSALSSRNLSWNLGLQQGFSPGTQLGGSFNTSSQDTNSVRNLYNPYTNSSLGFSVTQPLLRGFGAAVNRRFIRIARNDQKISDMVFHQQVIATVAGMIRLYYDLLSLIQDVEVKRQTLALAQELYENNRVSVQQGTLAPVELVRAQAQVAAARQDLANSEAFVRQQELVVKNVLSRNGTADATVRDARIVPTDTINVPAAEAIRPIDDLMAEAMQNRPELASARLQLANSNINLKGSRNAVLPEIDVVGSVQGNGLARQANGAAAGGSSPGLGLQGTPDPSQIGGLGSGLSQILRNRYPTYTVGVQINLPLRNRIAQADLARDEMQVRQTQVRYQQLQNQVRIEVEGAVLDLQRARTALDAAVETRELQEQSLKIEMERFQTGLSTTFLVMQYQGFVAQARSTEVATRGVYAKARTELERAIGRTLADHNVVVNEAFHGQILSRPAAVPVEIK